MSDDSAKFTVEGVYLCLKCQRRGSEDLSSNFSALLRQANEERCYICNLITCIAESILTVDERECAEYQYPLISTKQEIYRLHNKSGHHFEVYVTLNRNEISGDTIGDEAKEVSRETLECEVFAARVKTTFRLMKLLLGILIFSL